MNFYPKAGININVDNYYIDSYGSIENLISLAKNGNITAQEALGTAYIDGVKDFVEKDAEKAIGWLNSAVENGCDNPVVFAKLGTLLDLSGELQYKRRAYQLYYRAAEMGVTEAQINLAEMYRIGIEGVVNEDIKEAFEWYKKAADEAADFNAEEGAIGRLRVGTLNAMKGNEARLKALKLLYLKYRYGDCPEGRPQPTKAVSYLTRAAELGDTEAQLKLGETYLNGSCEQIKDVSRAKRWLGKASASGNAVAKQVSSFDNVAIIGHPLAGGTLGKLHFLWGLIGRFERTLSLVLRWKK